jgi:hypothetical protein
MCLRFVLPFAILIPGCGSGASRSPSNVESARVSPVPSLGPGPGPGVIAGGCPARGDAAVCPAPPPGYLGLVGPGQWVGCSSTSCSSPTSCTTCSCVDGDGGGVWDCARNEGFQPDSDAQPPPYCSFTLGPLDAPINGGGPFEQCTPQYPTCTPTSPAGASGWRCCLRASVGDLNETICMPNAATTDGAASGPAL